MNFEYTTPEQWHEEYRQAQERMNLAALVLATVAQGRVIITGERGDTIYYSGPPGCPPPLSALSPDTVTTYDVVAGTVQQKEPTS